MTTRAVLGAAAALLALAACAPPPPAVEEPPPLPAMAWDHHPEGSEWTEATLAALRSEGAALLSEVPDDIGVWCPAYVAAPQEQRAAFWAGLLSALARFESTWNEQAVGGGGRWFGLVQIAPATARGYGCAARSGAELQEGTSNLACAVRIMATTVTRDDAVAAGGGGLAADWGPFANPRKRAEMRDWISSQSYCRHGAAAPL